MPRTRKRKTPAGEMEAALLEPAVEKPAGNFIDFQKIIRESKLFPRHLMLSNLSQLPQWSQGVVVVVRWGHSQVPLLIAPVVRAMRSLDMFQCSSENAFGTTCLLI
ncbi:hypothetical protein DPMN_144280 [Dreissena polymorpha]|uniref:Uncharacterized protein n=1 Tax=Dreissena polymorpha TaxID=45954 RepID=A0A9D4JMF0_DREPO|nr:hypothetical protein DPMN_144280 [Dreissena polymorpha]